MDARQATVAGRMEIGRLRQLMQRLVNIGAGIVITPVVEESDIPTGFGNIEDSSSGPWFSITGWEITYETLEGTFTVRGKNIAEAVDAALSNPDAW